jgi:hypothetical protein
MPAMLRETAMSLFIGPSFTCRSLGASGSAFARRFLFTATLRFFPLRRLSSEVPGYAGTRLPLERERVCRVAHLLCYRKHHTLGFTSKKRIRSRLPMVKISQRKRAFFAACRIYRRPIKGVLVAVRRVFLPPTKSRRMIVVRR